ncbi:MAG: hypothetical protein R2750_12590 [Bacteroidales bacterium]
MSRKYKMHDKQAMYFISFATIQWIDVFVREDYFGIMAESSKLLYPKQRHGCLRLLYYAQPCSFDISGFK